MTSMHGQSLGRDPVRIPFCARQIFGQLRRRTSAGMVPARELAVLDAGVGGVATRGARHREVTA